jgi:general stress protein CsbA
MEMMIDTTKGLAITDVDELAYIASMVIKSKLDHTHYHHNMPGKGRANALRPSQILMVPPVMIEPAGWAASISAGRFENAELRAAKVHHATSEGGRSALALLRAQYIGLEDTLAFRIKMHRKTQLSRQRAIGWISFLGWGLASALLFFLLLLPDPAVMSFTDWVSLVLTAILLAMALYFRQRITRWDIPVVRLLRTAHGFFLSANTFNKVLQEIKLDGRTAYPVDCFSSVISNIASRLEGEQQRVAMGQNWLALAVGAASLVAAMSALKQAAPALFHQPPARYIQVSDREILPSGSQPRLH